MIFTPLQIEGAWLVEVQRHDDARGFFGRTWCAQEFAEHGIACAMAQSSVSWNALAGTLRGLHFSRPPSTEGKLVRCTRGRIHDVILDLRLDSTSFGQHIAIGLDQDQRNALYVPPGAAHGFQTLTDDCEVDYMMTEAHRPEFAGGVRYDDPGFGIDWPMPVTRISDRDRGFPDFDRESHQHLCTEARPLSL